MTGFLASNGFNFVWENLWKEWILFTILREETIHKPNSILSAIFWREAPHQQEREVNRFWCNTCVLFGVEVFIEAIHLGQRTGPPDSPVAFVTEFGRVLAGNTEQCSSSRCVAHHVSLMTYYRIFRDWREASVWSPDKRAVIQHYKSHSQRQGGLLSRSPGSQALVW